MATTAQILANRLNSRKSTGPKTDEGKDGSRNIRSNTAYVTQKR
jgi:hypothetical protein